MTLSILILLIWIAVFSIAWNLEIRRRFQPYRVRPCAGIRWRRRYPEFSVSEMRVFLSIFAKAFQIHDAHKLKFRPDDRIIDIYKALTISGFPDDFQFESLEENIESQYGVQLESFWTPEITLGQVFQKTRPV